MALAGDRKIEKAIAQPLVLVSNRSQSWLFLN
jgi:hypothetical protein